MHHELILLNLFTNDDIYNNNSYASYADWKIEKTPETNPEKLEFNIDKPETDLQKIEFNINIKVNDNEIGDMKEEEVVYPNDGLADDNNNNIKDSGVQHKQDDQHNQF